MCLTPKVRVAVITDRFSHDADYIKVVVDAIEEKGVDVKGYRPIPDEDEDIPRLIDMGNIQLDFYEPSDFADMPVYKIVFVDTVENSLDSTNKLIHKYIRLMSYGEYNSPEQLYNKPSILLGGPENIATYVRKFEDVI